MALSTQDRTARRKERMATRATSALARQIEADGKAQTLKDRKSREPFRGKRKASEYDPDKTFMYWQKG
jgi:hypothetical protein